MYFESGGIYHIYNQGNNRQKIFFDRENYLFFKRKVRDYILPYGNILAWCFMPNHFHLMVEVETVSISVGVTQSHPDTNKGHSSHPDTLPGKLRTLNDSIGIMLRSYTRAINIQENRTGNLFREETKAICLNEINGFASDWYTSFGVTFMRIQIPEFQYLQVCFNYIHDNPVNSGLVEKPGDWEFSSVAGLMGECNDNLANKERVNKLGLILRQ